MSSLSFLVKDVVSPVGIVSASIADFFLVVGAAFFLISVVRYMCYRSNPDEISTNYYLSLLLVGFVFIILPWLFRITDHLL